jgi:ABC-type nickel/cobalt efflux system permease component RcnA
MRIGLLYALIAGALCLLVQVGYAHPLGNYSINQYLMLDLRGERPAIYYLLDLAEIPSFSELDLIDPNFDSEVSEQEVENYLDAKVPELTENIKFNRAGEPVPLRVIDRRLALAEGSGAMVVINVLVKLAPETFQWPTGGELLGVEMVSTNYQDAAGIRECKVILGGRFVDRTKSIGREKLRYQTLVFQDENDNPVYQDFDAQFLLQFGPGTGEVVDEAAKTPVFGWTATARTARDSGDTLMASAFSKVYSDLTAVSDTRARPMTSTPLRSDAEPQPVLKRAEQPDGAAPTDVVQPYGRPDKGAAGPLFGRISELVRTKDLTPAMFIVGLAVALVFGMAHARSPGHGKTIVAAYLIGERGTVWNAVVLGLVVTLTHTWSVFLLGLVTLSASERISEERFSFWLGIVSGVVITAIGIALFLRRYSTYLLARHGAAPSHSHDHGEGHSHDHGHSHGHSHVIESKGGPPPSYWSILGLGVSGGIVPCPTALIVLLLAIRFGRLGYGMCLILSFSLGLALVLIALGIVVVRASGAVRRLTGEGRKLLLLSVFSSSVIIVLGLWVIVWTLLQYNVIVFMPGG